MLQRKKKDFFFVVTDGKAVASFELATATRGLRITKINMHKGWRGKKMMYNKHVVYA